MKKVTYRPASQADWIKIHKLIKLYPKQLVQKFFPKIEEFFVTVVDGEVVGCCALEVYSKRLAEIRSLVVKEEYQHQGIGKKLIMLCLKKAKKLKIFEVLSVTSAVELFESSGFNTFNNEKYAMLKVVKSEK